MSPEISEIGAQVLEQSERTSSANAHSPFRGPEASSTDHQVLGDMAIAPDENQHTNPVDTVDAAAAEMLKSAIEDGPGESWPMVEKKV